MNTTEILIKIRKIVRSINLESKKIQKEYGVSIPQVLCLNYLYRSTNYQSTQGKIRQFLNLNSSTISGIINRLEKKGLLAKLPKQGDKRVVNIVLTSAGAELLQQIPELLHEELSQKLEKLSQQQFKEIERGLDALVNLLDLQGVDASPLLTIEDTIDDSLDEMEMP